MKSKITGLLAAVFMTLPFHAFAESLDYYMQMNEAKLCIDYMTYPSWNINQSTREEAIARRGINCAPYAAIAANKNQSDKNLEDALRALANQR